ncbi:membrane protein [Sulfurifustis variabilis]|uniref:Membrane protein n=1 Tax=Sulfurifustis variabilis TaxID=1675686 RepID=A0A1C7AFA9_9GAMM|nr:CopD family protein [Sulfurifustis variabilis]BAU49966.1 membrane protein [Sulfurifustis variabilis]
MPFAITLHLLAAVVWVGGMFFAYMALRPVAATLLEPPLRLPLWSQVFGRFFPWVWAAILALPLTGYWMILGPFQGFASVRWYVHVMQAIGWVMIAIFLHIYFAPYRRLNRAVAAGDWKSAGAQLAQIRRLVGLNLILGLTTITVATAGAYFTVD